MVPIDVCDSHHHFWRRDGSVYLADDLAADVASIADRYRVVSTVAIEAGHWYRSTGPDHLRPVGETDWVVANAGGLTQGIVGYVDLRLGDAVDEVLAAHLDAAGGRFRGVRQMAVWDPSPDIRPIDPDPGPGLLGDRDFLDGFARLDAAGLSFDAWVFFTQLDEVADLARRFPDTPIVVDHLGGPIAIGPYAHDRDDVLARTRAGLSELARHENVHLKVGGIGIPLFGLRWHKRSEPPDAAEVAAAWGPEVRWCIETFGADRCMAESNFPVDRWSMTYPTVWEAFDLMTADLSPHERSAILCDTATRFYRLSGPAGDLA